MLSKGNKLYSILFNKCPRCHEGEFFKYKTSFNFNKITELHENCPHCKLKYMMEPSFFFGAMYVNYALAVALFVIVFIISKVLLGQAILTSFIAVVVVSFLLTPLTLRLSRIIWINIFVSYRKEIKKKKDSSIKS